MTTDLQLVIIADQLLTRAGLAVLLQPYAEIVGQTTSTANLVEEIELFRPNILLFDLGWSAAALLPQLSLLAEFELPLVALLAEDDAAAETLAALTLLRGYGLLRRDTPPPRLALALQAVQGGLLVLDPQYKALIAQTNPLPTIPTLDSLTKRELEVLSLLAQGETNKSIAHQLGITDHTVKFHVNAIMTKLGAQSRTDAVMRAIRAGWITL
jgi:DNA-binding NarL/FixJ family response regulator